MLDMVTSKATLALCTLISTCMRKSIARKVAVISMGSVKRELHASLVRNMKVRPKAPVAAALVASASICEPDIFWRGYLWKTNTDTHLLVSRLHQ